MDTQTGKIVYLSELEAKQAKTKWDAWKAGLLKVMPKYAPITGDALPKRSRRKAKGRKRARGKRSYKEFCN